MQPHAPSFVVTIEGQSHRYELGADGVCQIGRDPQGTVVLTDNLVSRRHAMVQHTESGECCLFDLGSRNGTFVNGRRIVTPHNLRDGDRITVGGVELVFHGCAAAAADPSLPAGETVVGFSQKLITVLVTDIRDFTGLSTRLPGPRLSEVVSTLMRQGGAVLAAEGAWGQKYIGDAIMAIWLHSGDEPQAAEMLPVFRALEKLLAVAAGLQERFALDAPIRLGAGVNTGLACIGNMGSGASSDYTALSDAVNLAFRLESATKELGCDLALGRKTHAILAARPQTTGLFECRQVALKGFEGLHDAYAASAAVLPPLLSALQTSRLEATAVFPAAAPQP